MKLYVDLETLQLIEGPGFRSPVSSLRFKRGDAARLEVTFLDKGLNATAIGDPAALEIEFGAKAYKKFDEGYLVHGPDWTMPDPAATAPSYLCSPNFNTAELNAALQLGTAGELPEILLMGEITWREAGGEPTSTRTFMLVVENDVNRGTELAPDPLQTPDEWLDARAVRHDAAQALPAGSQSQARANIGAAGLEAANTFSGANTFNAAAEFGGNLSVSGDLTVSGGNASLAPLATGDIDNMRIGALAPAEGTFTRLMQADCVTETFQRALPTAVDDVVEFGLWTLGSGASLFHVDIAVQDPSFGSARSYLLPVTHDDTAAAWRRCNPLSGHAQGGNDFALEIRVAADQMSLRARRTLGNAAGTLRVRVSRTGQVADVFAPGSATSSEPPPAGVYPRTPLRQDADIVSSEGEGTVHADDGVTALPVGFGGFKARETLFTEPATGAAFFGHSSAGRTIVANSRGSAGGGIDFHTFTSAGQWIAPLKLDRDGAATLTRGNAAGVDSATHLFLGYNNSENYRHALRTRHHPGTDAGNEVSFWIWKPADGANNPPSTRAFAIGRYIHCARELGIGTETPTEALDVVGNLTASGSNSTLPNQANLASPASILTRGSLLRETLFNMTRVRHLHPGNNRTISYGTGSYATCTEEWAVGAGTAAGGYGKAVMASAVNAFAASGNGIRGIYDFALAFEIFLEVQGSDGAGAVRVILGDTHNGAPAPADAAPISAQGWGIEWQRESGSCKCRLFGWDGAAIVYSGWHTVHSGGTGFTVNQHVILSKVGSSLSLHFSSLINAVPARPSDTAVLTLTGLDATSTSPGASAAGGRITLSAAQHATAPSPKVYAYVMGHAVLTHDLTS